MNANRPARRRLHIGDRVSPKAGQFRGDLGFVFNFQRREGQRFALIAFGAGMTLAVSTRDLRRA